MSMVGIRAGLTAHMAAILGDPARALRHMPDVLPYRGKHPYVVTGWTDHYTGFDIGRQRTNPPGSPDNWFYDYIDRMATGTTRTYSQAMDSLDAWVDAVESFYKFESHQCIPGHAFLVSQLLHTQLDPDGPYNLRSGEPVLLCRMVLHLRQTPYSTVRDV